MNLSAFLKNRAKESPESVCVVHNSKRRTYAEIDRLSDALAVKLIENGLRKGERVVILLENSAEYIISFFGILKSQGAVVPVSTQLVIRELSCILNDCAPKFVITDSRRRISLDSLIDPQFFICIDKLDLSQSQYPLYPDHSHAKNELAMIIYTSGTTGKPKGVMLSHGNLIANANSIIQYLNLGMKDSIMVILPFYYSYGISLLTTHIKVGAALVIDNRFLYPNIILDTMEKEGVTGFAGVPSHFAILLRKSALSKYKLSKLKYVTQAGGAMAPSMIKEFIEFFPHVKFHVMYGQTEASARLTYLEPDLLTKKIGSIGKAIPGVKIDILNEQGRPVEPGEIGEITASGDNIMLGYWNAPEETSKVLRENWLFTGDLAKMDEEGFIYIVSRKKEMIKSGSNRISPLEIEEVVCRMSGVLECAAVGVNDEILGEAISLFVVNDGASISEREIMLFCKQNLASYKTPKEVKLVSSLPKTSTGKVKRAELLKHSFLGDTQKKSDVCVEFAAPLI